MLVAGVCERSVQIDYDDHVTFQAIQYLYDTARSKDKRPFFLQVSYTHPHEPYLCHKEHWDLYDGVDMPMPRVPALDASEHDAHSKRLLNDFGMLGVRFEAEAIIRARRAYYGSISYIDEMVGRIIDTLNSTGMADNTAIVFTSDHGEMLGERGMWFKKHFFEPALRIPLIVKLPGAKPGRVASPASLVDLLPTFMGIATGAAWSSDIETLDGCDLTPAMTGSDSVDTERPIYAEYLAEATTAPIFMIRRGRYKYISSVADPALLFDIESDPNELNNLASQPERMDLVAQVQSEVHKKWDSDELTKIIKLSQSRRRLVISGYQHGEKPRWNHDENPGDQVIWYRGDEGYSDWAFNYLPIVDEK